ncbi:MAG: alpha/beta fold hydrolase [Granulosicoccus sp.]
MTVVNDNEGKPNVGDPNVYHISNKSGTRLALTRLPCKIDSIKSTNSIVKRNSTLIGAVPVVLAHGTFSNHRSCKGLALYLSQRGFDCWLLDFQGHGHSAKPVGSPTFESMCLEDTAAVLEFIGIRYPGQQMHWIGHSGGGLSILMYLCRNLNQQKSIASIVTLASQATHAAVVKKHRYAIKVSKLITQALGFAPGRWFKIGPENEFANVMLQWYRWSLQGKWLGEDSFDYENGMRSLTCPLLALAGGGDHFIAPADGCKHIFNRAGSNHKKFELCGLTTGYKENYSHARLISSSSASSEVWPLVSDWLEHYSPQS